ncbi:hypothetical protein ACQ86N_40715 [Puia sp. P3]|uniref:hypothetical protein n=1 Tax=Puia sp. P3 TaxID=3423952 RepID=UPI003D67390B
MPPTIRVVPRVPTAKEYQRLQVSVGWGKEVVEAKSPADLAAVDAKTEKVLAAAIHGVVAEEANGEVVGCALLLGDGISYYYVKDVMVHKNWQGCRIGTGPDAGPHHLAGKQRPKWRAGRALHPRQPRTLLQTIRLRHQFRNAAVYGSVRNYSIIKVTTSGFATGVAPCILTTAFMKMIIVFPVSG